jgi:hypothetical protein
MQEDTTLFEESGGSPARAFLIINDASPATTSPKGRKRAHASSKLRQSDMAKLLKKTKVQDYFTLEEWELAYRKACFYEGIRILTMLSRAGRIKP